MSEVAMPPIAVVTGAGSGIGRAVAIALAEAGFRLALIGRRAAPLEETAAACGDQPDILIQTADVTDEAQVEAAFAAVIESFGRIDLLFNNAGNFPAGASFGDVDYVAWRSVVDVNLNGAFLCARAAFRQMRTQEPRGGRIINNGSISAHAPRPQAAAYTASKHAITGLTKAILLDGRAHDIACCQIDIGNAATAMTAGFDVDMLQADGSRRPEPVMDVAHVARTVLHMATLPLAANMPFVTVMASGMPFIGRG